MPHQHSEIFPYGCIGSDEPDITLHVKLVGVGDDAMMFIRPEALELGAATGNDKTTISANVVNEEFEGNSFSVFLEGDGGKSIKMAVPNVGQDHISDKGENLSLHYDVNNAVVMPAGELASE